MKPSKLEKLSHFASAISCVAAIIAIGIGSWQFYIALDRADQQLELIQTERSERLNDGCPTLIIAKTSVTDYNYDPYNSYSLSLVISNIGDRPADSIMISTFIVATISEDNNDFEKFKGNSEPATTDTTEFITPLNKGISLETINTILEPGKMKNYRIKIVLKYFDTLLKKYLNNTYYYTVDFDKTLLAFHEPAEDLTISDKIESLITDSLIKLHYSK